MSEHESIVRISTALRHGGLRYRIADAKGRMLAEFQLAPDEVFVSLNGANLGVVGRAADLDAATTVQAEIATEVVRLAQEATAADLGNRDPLALGAAVYGLLDDKGVTG